jgi:hypothetical protein
MNPTDQMTYRRRIKPDGQTQVLVRLFRQNAAEMRTSWTV